MASKLKSYEKKYKALEEIVQELDSGEISLDELLAKYKKGLDLVKECSTILETVEDEVEQIVQEVRVVD